MGKYDKDRLQKEMAIRLCLAQGFAPFIEVPVFSSADLSKTVELLTDIDVLGLEFVGDGGFRKILYDCKTLNKMSPINRAFWAAGIMAYAQCDEAIIILKNKAVYNHRISALKVNVDLHDENSFEGFGKTIRMDFNKDTYYQSSIDRWNRMFDVYEKNQWSERVFSLCYNSVPLTTEPWDTFRHIIGALRDVKGYLDPAKSDHVAIVFDCLAAISIIWSLMGRDFRRIYNSSMKKNEFIDILRYYIWGGREAYQIRQDLRSKIDEARKSDLELPAWDKFTHLAGLIISAPQEFFPCAHISKEIALRNISGALPNHDKILSNSIRENSRLMQFVPSLAEYLIEACGLPKDFREAVIGGLQL